MQHELKCWPEYYELSLYNRKPFEVRYNDRNFQEGDTIWMREWNPATERYTGRYAVFKVGYVLRDYPALKENHVAMTIKPVLVTAHV